MKTFTILAAAAFAITAAAATPSTEHQAFASYSAPESGNSIYTSSYTAPEAGSTIYTASYATPEAGTSTYTG